MKVQASIPMAFSRRSQLAAKPINVLAGDVGGTKTNLALFSASADDMKLIQEATYPSSKYPSCVDIIKQFIQDKGLGNPDRVCLGVAGPVIQGKVKITNLPWELDKMDITGATGIQNIALLNDLEATAYGLAGLDDDDFIDIVKGSVAEGGNMAIIAPGTGLGEAGLFWDGKVYHPFPTEGGHSDFCPRTELDMELTKFLQKKCEVVSWEKVIAGPGIVDIYEFLSQIRNRSNTAWLEHAMQEEDPSAVISEAALAEKDPVCIETMQLFVRYLARESSNLVLKIKATGGLYLGGGIPPKISALLQQNVFYDNFLDNDRMQNLARKVPIRIILNNKTALIGAGLYGAYGEGGN